MFVSFWRETRDGNSLDTVMWLELVSSNSLARRQLVAVEQTWVQEPGNLHLAVQHGRAVLFLGSFLFPELPGGGDNYSQRTGVSKLAKGMGTKLAHDRQTTNRLLSPLQEEVSPSM